MQQPMRIGTRLVGPGHPPYVIAEIGANHNGDMGLARKLVDAAKKCGADAAKFQSWTPTSLISKAEYARRRSYSDKDKHFGSLEEMVKAYQLTNSQHKEIADYCRTVGIEFLSSAFSEEEVDLLDDLGVAAFKVASMDVDNLPLLAYIARKGKPVILSTGMATLAEIERALGVLRREGASSIIILHCIAIYPPPPDELHLLNIPGLAATFGLPVGFSDHTLGTSVTLGSIALGACVIEKHFTLDKGMQGWDHAISANPTEMAVICEGGRLVQRALGTPIRTVSSAELEKRKAFRRRIVVLHAKQKGEKLTQADLGYKRPGTGISPAEAQYVIGRTLTRDVEADHELEWTDLA